MRNHSTIRRMPLSPPLVCLVLAILSFVPGGDSRAAAYDLVVAQDGTGDYTTVQAAILAAPDYQATRTTIFIRAGTYKEKITVPGSKARITLVGADRATTVLTYDDHATINSAGELTGTELSSSVLIQARDFAARNLTFSNTAGDMGPAIAVWIQGNRSRFHNCAFLGTQDTLCTTGKKAYFRSCLIAGATDFIFGNTTAVFDRCTLEPLDSGYITAASTDEEQPYGYVFEHCKISGPAPSGTVYLGRPWTDYASVVFADCMMDDEIAPAGWYDWGRSETHGTAFFAEYNSSGAGADPGGRVDWSHQLTASAAADYTVATVFHQPSAPAGIMQLTVSTPWYNDY